MRLRFAEHIIAVCAAVLIGAFMAPGAEAQRADAFHYRIVAATPCYKTSPMQGRPPDAVLPAGAAIRLVPRSEAMGSYTRVATRRGLTCWIGNDAFRLVGK